MKRSKNRDDVWTHYIPTKGRYLKYLSILIRELSFRDPLEVTEIIYFRKARAGYAKCPRCRVSLAREYASFCDRCGQRLDWNDPHGIVIQLK